MCKLTGTFVGNSFIIGFFFLEVKRLSIVFRGVPVTSDKVGDLLLLDNGDSKPGLKCVVAGVFHKFHPKVLRGEGSSTSIIRLVVGL